MKWLAIPLILICTSFQADNFYNIIKVNGQIVNTSTGKSLGPGDKVKPSDNLQFDNRLANALAISSARGKFSLKVPEGADAFSDANLVAIADNAVSPIKSRNQLSTRSFGNGAVKDLKAYFGNDDFTIVGNTLQIKLDDATYPLNENSFIVFSYEQNGKQVSKKIGFFNQELKIEKEKLLSGTDELHITSVTVYLYNKTTNSPVQITKFNLNFTQPESISKEFKAVADVLNNMSMTHDEKVKYLTDYFVDLYGQTDMNNLNTLVSQVLPSDK